MIEWSDIGHSLQGTPTLMIVDAQGVVRRVWVGTLQKEQEVELLTNLERGVALLSSAAVPPEIELNLNDEELETRTKTEKIAIVDVRERHEFARRRYANALNIPLVELDLRAPFELSKLELNVIDCTGLSKLRCGIAIKRLAHGGFRAAALNAGLFSENRCATTIMEENSER